jgi:hypothetical protein
VSESVTSKDQLRAALEKIARQPNNSNQVMQTIAKTALGWCVECLSPIEQCRPLWAQQKCCCPECSHNRQELSHMDDRPESVCPYYRDGIHRPEKYVTGTHCRCQEIHDPECGMLP